VDKVLSIVSASMIFSSHRLRHVILPELYCSTILKNAGEVTHALLNLMILSLDLDIIGVECG
jgi:hypothetical protein